jgi:N-methylhydantoinase A
VGDKQDDKILVGIDIGGTFTDFLLFDPTSQSFSIGKTLTTPSDPAKGVLNGIKQLLGDSGVNARDMRQIVHGTTLVTNALIERKGAKTALITTQGFRDAVEIGREHRYDLYDLFLELPKPLVPRSRRLELDERTLADGSEHAPVDPESVARLVDAIRESGAEAVAISLLHSYQNPEHERQVFAILAELAPDLVVSASSDVVPEIREFERTSTTIANVYVRPLVERYLRQLESALESIGFHGALLVMLSSGGLSTVETAAKYPIRLIESGPAAGALAAAYFGELTGRPKLFSFDMGGTTAKCCLIGEQGPRHSAEFEVSRVYRFKKGSGLPISVPVIELIEIGSGGGSIARIDNLGLLKVGPDSAGADPGPASYGRGGIAPTVTDADLVLGFLDPNFFLGGEMKLDVDLARKSLEPIAERLGMSVEATAWGVHEVVNEQMAGAARIHAIEQGQDPREYPLFAFGGAGPVHAYRVSEILRAPEVIIPFGAGVASTIGFLVAPLAFDFVRTYVGRLDRIDWEQVNQRFEEMEQEGRQMLAKAGAPPESITIRRSAEMRYVGQGHEVTIDIPAEHLGAHSPQPIAGIFEREYAVLYGRTAHGAPIEAVNWRITAAAPSPSVPLELMGRSIGEPRYNQEPKSWRPVYQPERREFVETPVYDRYALAPGVRLTGPAIIEERESTIVVGPDATVSIDPLLSVVISMPRSEVSPEK